jgi:hypothetical protein
MISGKLDKKKFIDVYKVSWIKIDLPPFLEHSSIISLIFSSNSIRTDEQINSAGESTYKPNLTLFSGITSCFVSE